MSTTDTTSTTRFIIMFVVIYTGVGFFQFLSLYSFFYNFYDIVIKSESKGTTTSTTSTGSAEQALDTDFLKTSQNLQLGDIRKSLEHFTNLTDGPFSGKWIRIDDPLALFKHSGALEYSLSNSLSEGLSGVEHQDDKSFDHDLYCINNVLSSNIYGTLSSLTGKLISGLKVLDDSTQSKNEEKENQENVDTSL